MTRGPLKYKAAKKKPKFGPSQPHLIIRKDNNLANITKLGGSKDVN